VCHDASVDRTTNGVGRIAELSWREIRSLDAGVRFGKVWAGTRMPRLEQVLDLTERRIGLNVHVKDVGPDGSTIKRVCDLVRERALVDIAYVALGTESALRIAREYAPGVARACLIRQDDPSKSVAIAARYGCQRIQFSREVTREEIEQAHQAGLICNLFWSDDPQDAMAYVQQGIDVILTNCAHTLIAGGFSARGGSPC
jgi:glycerophosphoryl diester phosphodiesterase